MTFKQTRKLTEQADRTQGPSFHANTLDFASKIVCSILYSCGCQGLDERTIKKDLGPLLDQVARLRTMLHEDITSTDLSLATSFGTPFNPCLEDIESRYAPTVSECTEGAIRLGLDRETKVESEDGEQESLEWHRLLNPEVIVPSMLHSMSNLAWNSPADMEIVYDSEPDRLRSAIPALPTHPEFE
jgi:hypothetical protein